MVEKSGRKTFHMDLKKMIRVQDLFPKFGMKPLEDDSESKFTEVRLPIDDKDFEKRNLPLADAAGKIDEETFVFVEFDNGGQISHSLLKYFYYLKKSKKRPRTLYLFHIYGKEFAPEIDKNKRNYLFHRKLVQFLCDKIRESYKDVDFVYVPSGKGGQGFVKAAEAYKWLEASFQSKL